MFHLDPRRRNLSNAHDDKGGPNGNQANKGGKTHSGTSHHNSDRRGTSR